ncbi:hypothetical protein N9Z75_01975 [Akkermansiaceae bacterium]|nr:hypothetical protein [Akkermansiaceae bacterium]
MDGKVFRFYCCGPTVYGPAHIGNFRTFVIQDVMRRVLELGGMKTKHVRNITDVDDKTIRDSVSAGMQLADFTAQWRDRFHADCVALNCLKPHIEPSAVEHIPEQVAMIDSVPAAPSYVKQFSNLEAVDSLEHSRGQAPISLTQASKPLQVRLKPTPS